MSISLLNACINQLDLPKNHTRNLKIISGYLQSLKVFMLLLNNSKDNIQENLEKISSIIQIKRAKKNEVLIHEGEKGNDFFILLKGKIYVLTPKTNEYYMSEEEYILYLLKLRMKDQNELIQKCISLNQSTYPIDEDNFDNFVANLSQGLTLHESYSNNKQLRTTSQSVYKYITEQKKQLEELKQNETEAGKENKQVVIITPEEYIFQNSVQEHIIKYTKFIEKYLKRFEAISENVQINLKKEKDRDECIDEEYYKMLINKRSKVIIPTHEIFGELEEGNYFGEKALEEKGGGKRHDTIIAKEDCYIGVISKRFYLSIFQNLIEKALNKYVNFISSFFIFKNVSLPVWERKYISLFKNLLFEKNFILLKEGEANEYIYFIYKGEFELTINKNLIQVNELIISYKNLLRELITQSKTKYNNKRLIKECNCKEELKENDNFILNKKFSEDKTKNIIFQKRKIKMGIFSSKDIIGLSDIYSPEKENEDDPNSGDDSFKVKKIEMTSLFNCKCISCNCEVYSLPLNSFKFMCEHENKVGEFTNELEIQKLLYMIKRLKNHKEFLFETMYKNDKESKKEISEAKKKNQNKGQKNKFEPILSYTNLDFNTGPSNNMLISRQKTVYKGKFNLKKLSSSFNNFKSKGNNTLLGNNYKAALTRQSLNSRNKLYGLPLIDNNGKNKERLTAEGNDTQKSKEKLPPEQSEDQNNLYYKTRHYFVESNKMNKNVGTETNNSNTHFNKKSIFSKNLLTKKHNWVANVMVKNIIYNHIFDKYAFSSIKKDNSNSQVKRLKESEKIGNRCIDGYTSKNKNPPIGKNLYLPDNKTNNKTDINLFKNKSKNIKKSINTTSNNIINNKIYDALVFDNFNKCFRDTVYNKFFES